ncbi:MAG TPA: tetratricopeptide repeat protein [Syntrophorhabdaceae bacterium]|jgi:tetratricopeptide (TPR) repeat protein|nr:tetratricopeptide repeat protein [Syntrophorhabdaceae bacterium]MDI9560849.1 tetratricopeptide repeat protein [Pseudomonadota bacterium]HPH41657.1 tetratricopeptide repeat protein [Syntrophorhabdaceae bacterium]HPN98252.1 tetratricopeptide repeat protein [Syntrophorhabdaceae bacterium]HQI56424.1 tetratricopeptide repeat protein [Syntrophorhabdaceae bacterium]
MKFKIFFFLFLLFLIFYIYIDQLNPENVKLYVGYGKHYETSVATYVVVSFVLGVIFSIIISFFYDIKRLVTDWREDRKEKRKDEFRDLLERAKSYEMRGDREKAIETLNKVTRKAPDIEETYMRLSDLYVSTKEYDKAIETLEFAETNIGKRESIILKKVRIRLLAKKTEKLEEETKEILEINESNIDALIMLRDYYISSRNWEEAYNVEGKIRKFIKTKDEDLRALGIRYGKVEELFEKNFEGHSDAIIKELKEIISEDKRFIPSYILLAEVYKMTDKLNEAGRVYGRGYSKTGHIIFLLKMEDLFIDRGDPEVILKIYRRIIDISPDNYLILFLYARLCLRLGMIDESIDTLTVLFSEGLEFKGLHKAMAEAYIHKGEMGKAVSEFRKAFPAEHVYIPFVCTNCGAKKVEWVNFCDNCNYWDTVNVKKEGFLPIESSELKMYYEGEGWGREGV